MQLLVQDVIALAMGKIGVARINELPTVYELNTGLKIANIMLGEWSIEHLMLRGQVEESFALTEGVGTYTIGVGKSFNTAKPLVIHSAYVRDSNNVDTPVLVVNRDKYDSYQDKAFSRARPVSLYYDPGLSQQTTPPGFGTIYLYYIPDGSTTYTLYIESDKYLTEFVNLTDAITFEAAYHAALINNLAVALFRYYHGVKVPIPADIREDAELSKRKVMTINSRPLTAPMDLPGQAVGPYNIYTGLFNNQ